MAYLLDTDIAIHLREREAAFMQRFDELAEPPSISVVTQVELEGRVYKDAQDIDRRREAVDTLLEILPVIDFNAEMARRYGSILAGADYSRRKVIDRMIAATALVNGLTLITVNGRDFSDIPELELEVWTS